MRIAVLARNLGPRRTGRGFAAGELLDALIRTDSSLDILAFTDRGAVVPGCATEPGRGSGMLGDLAGMGWRIGRSVRRFNPDLFWSTTHLLPFFLPPTLPRVLSVNDVIWRDLPETMSRRKLLACRLQEGNITGAAAVIAISDFTRSRILVHWPHLEPRVHTIPLASNPRLRAPNDARKAVKDRFGVDAPFCLTVGTIEPRKNHALLLDAAERRSDVRFVICGPAGWGCSDIRARAARLANVTLTGFVDETELSMLYAAAEASVFPSRYEGFHLPALDGASLGSPVLASDVPIHREILGDGALYFPPDSPDEMLRLLDVLRTDPSVSARLRGSGPARASTYDWSRSAASLLGLFRSLLSRV